MSKSEITLESGLEKAREHLALDDERLISFDKAARSLFAERSYEEASDAYFFLSQLFPLEPAFWQGLGMSERKRGRYEKAAQALSMAAVMQPQEPQPPYLLALCLEELGEREEAIKALDCAIATSSQTERAKRTRNRARSLKGRWGE